MILQHSYHTGSVCCYKKGGNDNDKDSGKQEENASKFDLEKEMLRYNVDEFYPKSTEENIEEYEDFEQTELTRFETCVCTGQKKL